MCTAAIPYLTPPRPHNPQGRARRVGVEIEFSGVSGLDAAVAVQRAVGGKLREVSPHRTRIERTAIGEVTIELDAKFVHPASADDQDTLMSKAKALAGSVVQAVVPLELITQPLEVTQLPQVDRVVRSLRLAGAEGTEASPVYAFGLHLNPQVASYEPQYLVAILRAFTRKNRELREQIEPDGLRKVLGWAEPFAPDYIGLLDQPDYAPDQEQLITDYVQANPGRNYDLDMLPLFAFLDEAVVTRHLGEQSSAPRPTFHYRLPNSLVDQPDWSIAEDWNRWVEVERLAEDLLAQD